ncbi:hypothetical protein SteCoe_11268 [Stentor coeruleus]|uniref:Cell wall hydrolase SleB domain-containing protein n=1 Tax=Stentor coeruleus TaxID=5963 RepID=A0A1R2CDM8_9CILI|nr:hypothetical protein SteCoe_11268 [Stentor coeruleus]
MSQNIPADTLFNEAGNQGEAGMRAVASTMVNRHNMNRQYLGGSNYDTICLKGYEGSKISVKIRGPADQRAYETAVRISNEMRSGNFHPTNNYTHFDTSRSSFSNMEGPRFQYQEKIGSHYFFKER